MSELNNTWIDMSNDEIGFYVRENSQRIPNKRGVYAWFYPLWLNFDMNDNASDEQRENNLRDQVRKIRNIHAYDPLIKNLAFLDKEFDFKWEPLNVNISKKPEKINLYKKDEKTWNDLSKKGEKTKTNTKKYALLGTLFTRPLYIGLADNLNVRYNDHINGYGNDNNFNKRITDYFLKINVNYSVSDLLFVCIPFDEIESSKNKDENIWRNQQEVIENILKVIGQPIFGSK